LKGGVQAQCAKLLAADGAKGSGIVVANIRHPHVGVSIGSQESAVRVGIGLEHRVSSGNSADVGATGEAAAIATTRIRRGGSTVVLIDDDACRSERREGEGHLSSQADLA
jgi:hypothetical protein